MASKKTLINKIMGREVKGKKKSLLERYGNAQGQIVQIAHVAARVLKDEGARQRMQDNTARAEVLAGIAEDCEGIAKHLSAFTPTMVVQRFQTAEKYGGEALVKEWQRLCPDALKALRPAAEVWQI